MTTFDTIKPEPERDRYGRYVIHPAAGGRPRAYTRATTIADTLDDRHNLEKWMQRMVAVGLVQRPDLYASAASLNVDERDKLNAVCDQAREAAKGSAGSNLGTALHRFVERINHGEDVKVPAPWDYDLAAYQATMKAQGLKIDRRHLERVVVLEEMGVAGTFDLLVAHDDDPYRIADLKTGATLDWSWCAIAIQLALYAHADTMYDLATKTHEPMPAVDQDVALVIHLPAGQATCTLYEVDIAAGWEAAQHALWARAWRKRKKDLAVPVVIWGEEPRKKRSFGDEIRARTVAEESVVTIADVYAVEMVRRRFDKLTGDQKAWCDAITAEASVAGKPISLAAVASPSLKTLEIGRALVRFATLDPDDRLLRAALEHIVGEQQSNIPLGFILGALTMAQADALNVLVVDIHDGKWSVVYTDDAAQLTAA